MKRSTDTELIERMGNQYALTVAVYQRAQQLNERGKPLIKTDLTNPVAIAIEEIRANQVKVISPKPRNLDIPV